MRAHVQILSGLIRVPCDKFGEPYQYPLTFASTDGVTVTLMGLKADGGFTHAHRHAIARALKEKGFCKVEWERRKTGKARKECSTTL